jgi:hypothetical protein
MSNPGFNLTVTTDELLAVLQVMGATTMNGLGDPLAGLSEQEQAARLNAGAETLLNRGLCRIEGEQLIMDDMLVAFVGASLIPEATLLLTVIQPDQTSEPHYFNATGFIMVEHQSPRPGIHLFSLIGDAQALQDRLDTLLAPMIVTKRNSNAEVYTLEDAAVTALVAALRADQHQQAAELLAKHGWSAGAANSAVADLASASLWVGMVGWGLREEQPAGSASLMLYVGAERYWLFAPATQSPGMLTLTNPSSSEAAQAFIALTEPLLRLAPTQ